MAIDFRAIKNKFMLIAQEKVGASLYQEDGVPAVIDERSSRERPPYPYITVDLFDVSEDTVSNDYTYIDDTNGNLETYENSKTLMISYHCYGGESSDDNAGVSLSILNDLRNFLSVKSVLDDLETTVGVSAQALTSINTLPTRLSTKYLETASFNVIVQVIDTFTDPDTFIINEIGMENSLYPPNDINDVSIDLTIITP